MKSYFNKIRSLVKREGAARYLRITLVCFGLSVIVTRIFLQATGFPQIGTADTHIAHLLFGGLLLFIASLLPLLFANRWVFTFSAVLSGTGVGLFIDEVGKFISRTNDYFLPEAMPIIYAFFLLTLLLYLQIKRPPPQDTRADLYRAFDSFQEVLDYDLETQELSALVKRLKRVQSQSENPSLAALAAALLNYLETDARVVPEYQGFFERLALRASELESRLFTNRLLKILLIVSLLAFGIYSFFDLVSAFWAFVSPAYLVKLVETLISEGRIVNDASVSWFLFRLLLQGIVGVLIIVASVFIAVGREKKAINFAYFGLLASLTTVNLLVFYFDQFKAIYTTLGQLVVLLLVVAYRRRVFFPSK